MKEEPGRNRVQEPADTRFLSDLLGLTPEHRDEQLLADLLRQQPGQGRSATRADSKPHWPGILWRAGLVVALIWGAATAGRMLHALWMIRSNVQAMQLPPTSARSGLIQPLSNQGNALPSLMPMLSPAAVTGQATATATSSAPGVSGSNGMSPSGSKNAVPTSRPTSPALPVDSANTEALTVLLLGVDRRPEETGPARADSIIVARIDPARQRIALLSLPRDLVVNIPGYGADRINAANVHGELYPALGGGAELTRKTVSQLLGIPIDHVVAVDFRGFISAVDAIGGITLDVPTELHDTYSNVHFAPGVQHMDGLRTLWYSRVRHMDSDFHRMSRQHAVLLGILSRIREQNMLQQLRSIAKMTGALRGYVQTDVSEGQMINLAWTFRNVAPDAIERYRLDEQMISTFVNPADPYAQYASPGAIDKLVRQLLNGPTP